MTGFRSRRSALTARRGILATSQPLAARIELRVLQDGGHAVDAAVATAAALPAGDHARPRRKSIDSGRIGSCAGRPEAAPRDPGLQADRVAGRYVRIPSARSSSVATSIPRRRIETSSSI